MMLLEHILFVMALQGSWLGVAYCLRSCHPRFVAWICTLSICAFVFPWSQLGGWLSQHGQNGDALISGGPLINEIRSAIAHSAGAAYAWGYSALGIWLLVAISWITWTFSYTGVVLKRWSKSSQEGHGVRQFAHGDYRKLSERIDIRRLPDACFAVTSGLWRPKIWIGERVVTESQLRAALNHELTHLRSGDQYLVVLLTILERALWWNPFVWLLAAEARRQLEYDCDQRCKQLLGEREYKRSLAELALMKAGVPAIPSALALQTRTGVIVRMKRIGQSYSTTPAHLAVVAAFIGTSVFASTVLAVDSSAATPTIMECENKIPDGAQWRMSIDRDTVEGTLSITLVDAAKPDSHDVPEGSGPYVQCLYSVLGVPEEHLPAVKS